MFVICIVTGVGVSSKDRAFGSFEWVAHIFDLLILIYLSILGKCLDMSLYYVCVFRKRATKHQVTYWLRSSRWASLQYE